LARHRNTGRDAIGGASNIFRMFDANCIPSLMPASSPERRIRKRESKSRLGNNKKRMLSLHYDAMS
jgi:hypothetical protein